MPTSPTKRTAKTPAKPRLRKVAMPEIKPLSVDDFTTLHDLLQDAHDSNLRLVSDGQDLENARCRLRVAEAELRAAELVMTDERERNANIHTQLAPLLHRLPTV